MMITTILASVLTFVDPFIGSQGTGHTTPAAAFPLGFIQAGPDTGADDWKYCSGYQHDDEKITGFTQTHLSGTGCTDLGDVRLMPTCQGGNTLATRKQNEVASPGYYAVELPDNGVKVEITVTPRMAIYRMKFKQRKAFLNIVPQSGFGNMKFRGGTEQVGKHTFRGEYIRDGWAIGRKVAYYFEFSKPIAKNFGKTFVFDLGPDKTMEVRVALSGKDIPSAKNNLDEENVTFETAKAAVEAAWESLLGRVEAKGTDDQLKAFYTSLYHLYFQPNNIADADEFPYYSTFSFWDTFRAAHPLYTILTPEKVDDFCNSILKQAKHSGFMPIWTLGGYDNQCMIGCHSIPVVVDWYLKSKSTKVDWEALYKEIKQSLTTKHQKREKDAYDLLDKYGYIPLDSGSQTASRTLECSYDDWCAGVLARELGKKEDAEYFFNRSKSWQKLWDRETGFMRPKDSEGKWREPFNPLALGGNGVPRDYTEGNAWQYSWHVLQDIPGLIELHGGKEPFGRKLSELFTVKAEEKDTGKMLDVTGLIGQYAHGNEPSHHIIYLFQYAGMPEKTAEYVREVFDTQYGTAPDGLCGNDDCGQMSAWYLFSAMGFYPVNPCGGEYILGAPQFEEIVLSLAGGKKFKVVAKGLSKENKYVKSVTLNGKPVEGFAIQHAEIMKGGELVFEMGGKQ